MRSQLNEVRKLQKIAGLLNESDLNELSPQLRNASAKKAADKYRFSNALTAPIKHRQYKKFKEMPAHLQAIGEKLGEEIALENQYSYDGITLVKAIHDTKGNAMGQDDFIRYKVFLGKGARFFEVLVNADAEEPIPTEGSVRLSAELARKVLNFIKKLKPEIAGSKPSASSNELEEAKEKPKSLKDLEEEIDDLALDIDDKRMELEEAEEEGDDKEVRYLEKQLEKLESKMDKLLSKQDKLKK